jgi:hypothetical protein
MATIEIIAEVNQEATIYRAICGEQEATGATPGQALDLIEQKIGDVNEGSTLIIMRRFRPDKFFTREQQHKLEELMLNHHQKINKGQIISSQEQQELSSLVEAEFEAAIERSRQLLSEMESN